MARRQHGVLEMNDLTGAAVIQALHNINQVEADAAAAPTPPTELSPPPTLEEIEQITKDENDRAVETIQSDIVRAETILRQIQADIEDCYMEKAKIYKDLERVRGELKDTEVKDLENTNRHARLQRQRQETIERIINYKRLQLENEFAQLRHS